MRSELFAFMSCELDARVLSVLLHKDGILNGQKLQPVKIPFNVFLLKCSHSTKRIVKIRFTDQKHTINLIKAMS